MTGEDSDVVGKVENPGPHGLEESIEASPGKVGSADRPGKELVPGEEPPLLGEEEAAVTRRVPGRVPDLDAHAGELENVTVGEGRQLEGRREVGGRTHPEERPELEPGVEGEKVVGRMHVADDPGPRLHLSGPPDVVDVPVGDKEGSGDELMAGKEGKDAVGVRWGVDDEGGASGGGRPDPRVGLRVPEDVGIQDHRVRTAHRART